MNTENSEQRPAGSVCVTNCVGRVFLTLISYHTVSVFTILIDRNLLLGKKLKKKKKSLNFLENLSRLEGSNEKPRFGGLHASAAYLSKKKISWIK